MARVMLTTPPSTYANNTLNDHLTCPVGHKYEVLECFTVLAGAAGVSAAIFKKFAPGGGYLFAAYSKVLGAGEFSWRASFGALVLNPGEALSPSVFANGGAWNFWATYIDVSPT